ncbi:MAG: lipid A oxidase, partial [Pseudomonadota bacterium]
MFKRLSLSALITLALSSTAHSEFQISAYGGFQSSPHSDVTITGANPDSFTAGWEGRSFEAPPFWGVRGTWWIDQMPGWGLSLDFT